MMCLHTWSPYWKMKLVRAQHKMSTGWEHMQEMELVPREKPNKKTWEEFRLVYFFSNKLITIYIQASQYLAKFFFYMLQVGFCDFF